MSGSAREVRRVTGLREGVLLRAMPWMFVLIWSTGFVVARYGMPHAPPLTFLCIRYALCPCCASASESHSPAPLGREVGINGCIWVSPVC